MHLTASHLFGAACVIGLAVPYLLLAAPRIWRGEVPLSSRVLQWPFGRTSWCAFARALPFEALHFVSLGVALVIGIPLVAEVDVCVGWGLVLTIMFFNRPKVLVPPLYRTLPGLATCRAWRASGQDHELAAVRTEAQQLRARPTEPGR